MKKVATLFTLLFLFAVSFVQAQTDNDPMYSKPVPRAKSDVVEQGSIPEAGEYLIAASNSYTYAKVTPVIFGLAGAVLIVTTDNSEAGYGIAGAGALLGIYFGFRGDSQLRKAGRKLQLYSGSQGLGMSFNLR